VKQRILYFSDNYLYGGSDRNIINILNYVAEQLDLKVFFAYRSFKTYQTGVNRDVSTKVKAIPLFLLSNDTLFHRINKKITNRFLKKIVKLPFWLIEKAGFYAIHNYLKLRKTMKGVKPNLVHVNNGGYPASSVCQTAIFAAKHAGVQKILYHINNPAQRQGIWFDRLIDTKINQYTDFFITASKQAQASLAQHRFFDAHKLVQIYNTIEDVTIDTSREEFCTFYKIENDKFILCEIAFLSERKGQIYILKALNKIKSLYPDIFSQVILFLVGDGEDYHKLKDYCQINELYNVIFTGYQKNYVDYIACSDLFLLPSVKHEDMPLVILAAMKLGKPIIATKLAGIAEEIEDRHSGILLEVENLENLEREIVELFRDSELRQYYAENARQRFNEHFAPAKVYGDIKTLYAKLSVFLGEGSASLASGKRLQARPGEDPV